VTVRRPSADRDREDDLGHFIAEERPEETIDALRSFLS
jgi:hypothetical protein